MAASSSSATFATVLAAAAVVGPARSAQKRTKVNYIHGVNSFTGLKAQNHVALLGLPVCAEQSFAKIVSSLKKPGRKNGGGGGALAATCNAVAEIFRIAAIMPGLVLVGVAVGFVLLRLESTLEEE